MAYAHLGALGLSFPSVPSGIDTQGLANSLVGYLIPPITQAIKAQLPAISAQLAPAIRAEVPGLVQQLLPTLQAAAPQIVAGVMPAVNAQLKILEGRLTSELQTNPAIAQAKKEAVAALAIHAAVIIVGVWALSKAV